MNWKQAGIYAVKFALGFFGALIVAGLLLQLMENTAK